MFRIALISIVSVVLLLAAAGIAAASGFVPTNSENYGHAIDMPSHVGRVPAGDTTTTGDTTAMPGYNETMASHIEYAADQMREHAAQLEASTHMQQATGMDPGAGMQSDNMGTGSGYMDTDNMGTGSGYGSGYMNTDTMGTGTNSDTMGSGTGSDTQGTHMGATGPSTNNTSSSGSMMGR